MVVGDISSTFTNSTLIKYHLESPDYIVVIMVIFLWLQDLVDFDDENQKLVLENNALIRAVSNLSITSTAV